MPITAWNEKKGRILTNVAIGPSLTNGLTKQSVVDCLQTRPVDHRLRLVKILGKIETEKMREIDHALKIVFNL